jgi:hypothetical protein
MAAVSVTTALSTPAEFVARRGAFPTNLIEIIGLSG